MTEREHDVAPPPERQSDQLGRSDRAIDARVVLLTNFVPPYRLPLYELIGDRISSFTVLVSTPMETNRQWRPESGRLVLRVQRTLSLRRSWRHPAGFSDPLHIHIPWDTLLQLRRLRPDVVISGELGFRSLFAAAYCLVRREAKLVLWATLSERTEEGRGLLRPMLRKRLLRRADRVIVNGASGARYVERFGVPSGRIDRIPYVALRQFASARVGSTASGGVRHLLFVGQLTERKGLMPFLEALDAWSCAHPDRPPITFTVVGSGPVRTSLDEFRPAGRITLHLVGERDPDALPALFGRADVFCFPTLADEWGLVVNEALAAGLPVLGSVHSQAVEELCEDGVTGWVFTPDDPVSTHNALERALSTEPRELDAMQQRARERVSHLTPEWAADRMLATLRVTLAAG